MLQKFYYNTIRKTTVAFATLFNDINIDRQQIDDTVIQTLKVPLQYAQKEKFVQIINQKSGINNQTDNDVITKITLPRMGFEIDSISYAAERKTNSLNRISKKVDNVTPHKAMYNRIPYDISFSLYIATRKLDDSFRIVEQILPYFTPSINVKIKDMDEYDITTNVPIVLNSVTPLIDADGGFDSTRTILWTLTFTAKTFIYAPTNATKLIEKVDVEFNDADSLAILDKLTCIAP